MTPQTSLGKKRHVTVTLGGPGREGEVEHQIIQTHTINRGPSA